MAPLPLRPSEGGSAGYRCGWLQVRGGRMVLLRKLMSDRLFFLFKGDVAITSVQWDRDRLGSVEKEVYNCSPCGL